MGLFGKNDDKEAENAAMKAEYARLEALPLERLAEEILVCVYGDGGIGDDGGSVTLSQIVNELNPGKSVFGIDERVRSGFSPLLSEGVQVLEHARWIVGRFSGGDISSMGWALTRAGRAALASGQTGVALAPRA
jgi:hypothetical protein